MKPAHEDEHSRRGVDWRLWRRVFAHAQRYPRTLLALAATSLLTASCDVTFPLLTRGVIDTVVAEGSQARLLPWALAYAGVILMLAVCVLSFIHFAGRLSAHVAHDIREEGFRRLHQLSLGYHDSRPVGWLVARMTSDCDRLSNIIAWGVLDFAWGGTVIGGVTLVMLVLDWRLALVTLAVVPPLVGLSLVFQRRILAAARGVRRANSHLTAAYNESIQGVRTAKVLVREQHNLSEFQRLSGDMWSASLRNALVSALYAPVVLTLGSLGTALALVYGGLRVEAAGLSLGTLVAFLHYTGQLFDPINETARTFASLQTAQAAAERTMGLLATRPEIEDSPQVRSAIERTRREGAAPGIAPDGHPARIGEIRFEDVGFSYPGGRRVLDGFDLSVRAGETIALVGPTGGGKSTIVSLLCRFHEPQQGRILLDGTDYRERSLEWLQSQLGIVLQTPYLFRGTLRENIRYGRLEASDEEVERAARLVDAHDFIVRLEKGYDTQLGEAGQGLSVGQRQLVSFARALLAEPQILVMDEATASVDTETEQRIQRALEQVLEGRTSFVIAHRLSTVRRADRILLIDEGRIVEQGSHRQLMRAAGRYHSLYLAQAVRGVLRGDAAGA